MKWRSCFKYALAILMLIFGLLFHTTLLVHVQFLTAKSQQPFGSSVWAQCKEIGSEHARRNFTGDVQCEDIFQGDFNETCKWKEYHQVSFTDEEMVNKLDNCDRWTLARGYPHRPNSEEEGAYPIAFSISLHGNVEQFERLLRLIYWPQNLYCIHVDQRASNFTLDAVKRLSNCFPNVFVTRSEYVYWAGFGVLQAVLNCMSDTLTLRPEHQWQYFINLAGQDFPLKTNLELVRILTLLNGSNDVELNYEAQFSRYWFSHRVVPTSDGRTVTHVPDFRKSKLPVPNNLKVYKGNLAATLSRKFVEFLFDNEVAKNFTYWLRDTDTADEHLWATLNHNRIGPTGRLAPGGYPGGCQDTNKLKTWISRYVQWRNEQLDCRGKYVRDVCILGVGDLSTLVKRPELFVNKFYINYQSKAFSCMEEWFLRKVRENRVDINPNFYSTLDGVKYQLYNNRPRTVDASDDACPTYMTENRTIFKSDLPDSMKKYIKGSIIAQVHV